MTTNTSRYRLAAWALLSVYAVFWLSWSLHHVVVAEHHHHKRKVCHVASGETHLHSEEYAGIDCTICQIAPSVAELPRLLLPAFVVFERPNTRVCRGESDCLVSVAITQAQPRAPPAS